MDISNPYNRDGEYTMDRWTNNSEPVLNGFGDGPATPRGATRIVTRPPSPGIAAGRTTSNERIFNPVRLSASQTPRGMSLADTGIVESSFLSPRNNSNSSQWPPPRSVAKSIRSTTPLAQRTFDAGQSQDRNRRPPRPSDLSQNALSAAERESGLHMQRIGDGGDGPDAGGGPQDMRGSPDVSPPGSPLFASLCGGNGQPTAAAAAAAANAAHIVGYYSETSEEMEDGPGPSAARARPAGRAGPDPEAAVVCGALIRVAVCIEPL